MDHAAQFLVTKGASSDGDISDSSAVDAADISSSASKPTTAVVP
jgi:hypothetical protein